MAALPPEAEELTRDQCLPVVLITEARTTRKWRTAAHGRDEPLQVSAEAPFCSEIRVVGSWDHSFPTVGEVPQPAFGADRFLPKA
jgi:hypothetical protein